MEKKKQLLSCICLQWSQLLLEFNTNGSTVQGDCDPNMTFVCTHGKVPRVFLAVQVLPTSQTSLFVEERSVERWSPWGGQWRLSQSQRERREIGRGADRGKLRERQNGGKEREAD